MMQNRSGLTLLSCAKCRNTKHIGKNEAMLIKDLYQVIDLNSVGNSIYDIVADLIYAIPNLALEIIEKTSGDTAENNINPKLRIASDLKIAIRTLAASSNNSLYRSAD